MGLMPGALVLPLRDAVRGVETIAQRSRKMLRPSTARLPGAVRDFAHDVIDGAKRVGERTAFRRHPAHDDIADACALLGGTLPLSRGARPLAAVLAYGLERGLGDGGRSAPLVSETVLALAASEALRGLSEEADGPMRGALLVARLAKAPVAGPVPGTPIAVGADDRERVLRALVASILWLLAERPDDGATEDEILELAMSLTAATMTEIAPMVDDAERLAAELHRLADVI